MEQMKWNGKRSKRRLYGPKLADVEYVGFRFKKQHLGSRFNNNWLQIQQKLASDSKRRTFQNPEAFDLFPAENIGCFKLPVQAPTEAQERSTKRSRMLPLHLPHAGLQGTLRCHALQASLNLEKASVIMMMNDY